MKTKSTWIPSSLPIGRIRPSPRPAFLPPAVGTPPAEARTVRPGRTPAEPRQNSGRTPAEPRQNPGIFGPFLGSRASEFFHQVPEKGSGVLLARLGRVLVAPRAQRRSHLADVVVDGVGVPLAGGVARFVGVDLGHWHVDAVSVATRSLCSVRRDRLRGTGETLACVSPRASLPQLA